MIGEDEIPDNYATNGRTKSLGQTQLSAVEALSNPSQCKGSLLPRDEPHPNAYGSMASERVLTEK